MVDYGNLYATANSPHYWYTTTSNSSMPNWQNQSTNVPLQGLQANQIWIDEVREVPQNLFVHEYTQDFQQEWITLDPMPDLKKDLQCADGWDPDEN